MSSGSRYTGECSKEHLTRGTWCSGITSASHAEGPGFKSQCVHLSKFCSAIFPYVSCADASFKITSDIGVSRTMNTCLTSAGDFLALASENGCVSLHGRILRAIIISGVFCAELRSSAQRRLLEPILLSLPLRETRPRSVPLPCKAMRNFEHGRIDSGEGRVRRRKSARVKI